MTHEAWVRLARDCGANKATIIEKDQIVLSAAFRDICAQNGCGVYGRCWMCPPDVGDIHVLMDDLKTYTHGLWYQSIGEIEDSFDIEGMTAVGAQHARLSQKIQAAVKAAYDGDVLHLTCGGCRLCEKCAKVTDEPCRFPEKALPSLEAYGVDVYNTTKDTDLKYINGQNTVTFFGMVLFREKDNV